MQGLATNCCAGRSRGKTSIIDCSVEQTRMIDSYKVDRAAQPGKLQCIYAESSEINTASDVDAACHPTEIIVHFNLFLISLCPKSPDPIDA